MSVERYVWPGGEDRRENDSSQLRSFKGRGESSWRNNQDGGEMRGRGTNDDRESWLERYVYW